MKPHTHHRNFRSTAVAAATPSFSKEASQQVSLLICGEHFDATKYFAQDGAAYLQHTLHGARERFGHALCLCRRKPLKLQIRLRDHKCHLAVWPEEGGFHDSNCYFFREEDHFNHVGQSVKSKEYSHDEVRELSLAFAFGRSTGADQRRERKSDVVDKISQSSGSQITLRALANLLWEDSRLTRWHPKWSRDWGRTRYELMQTAEKLTSNGEPLSSSIFIPRPYRENSKDILNAEWDRFFGEIARSSDNSNRSGLIIAPVRKLTKLPNGMSSIHLRHLRVPIGLHDGTLDFITQNCRTSMRRIKLNEIEESEKATKDPQWHSVKHPEIIAFLHVEVNSRGGMWSRAAWLMPVHPEVFIPANSADEVLLIDALMREKHQFSRIISTQQPSHRTHPEWIIRHVVDPFGRLVPRAILEIQNNGSDAAYLAARAKLAENFACKGVPVWTWTPLGRQTDHVIPALPPLEELLVGANTQHLESALDGIQRTPQLSYVYGAGKLSIYLEKE